LNLRILSKNNFIDPSFHAENKYRFDLRMQITLSFAFAIVQPGGWGWGSLFLVALIKIY
jgi:hypothetical protein